MINTVLRTEYYSTPPQITPVLNLGLHQYSAQSTAVLSPKYWSTLAGVLPQGQSISKSQGQASLDCKSQGLVSLIRVRLGLCARRAIQRQHGIIHNILTLGLVYSLPVCLQDHWIICNFAAKKNELKSEVALQKILGQGDVFHCGCLGKEGSYLFGRETGDATVFLST